MANYFENVKTLNDLKAEYRRLAMANHPDLGGRTAVMGGSSPESRYSGHGRDLTGGEPMSTTDIIALLMLIIAAISLGIEIRDKK